MSWTSFFPLRPGHVIAAFVALTCLGGGTWLFQSQDRPAAEQTHSVMAVSRSPWDETYFPNAPVVTHDGRTLRFYDDLVRGKIVVVNFIYTSCSNICPLITARLSQVKDLLGDRVGRDIFFYSITIDPVVDGPEVLKKYAETYNAGPGWMFLTGKPEDIDIIRYRLGERSRSKAEHRNDVMIGNDRTGQWGRDSAFSDIEVLAETIRRFDPEWSNEVRVSSALDRANISHDLSTTPGKGLFIKACSGCHTIGSGDRIGPDLKGVIDRRNPIWLREFMREPDALRARKDPLAVQLDDAYPGVRMPNLGLSPTDVEDLVTYLKGASVDAVANVRKVDSEPEMTKMD